MQITTIRDLIQIHLQMLHNTETQLIEALPLLTESASMQELKDGLADHLERTKEQAVRLQKIGEDNNIVMSGTADMAMMYILKANTDLLQQITDPEVKDMAIIGGSSTVEHYEISKYEGVIALCKHADLDKIADALGDSLKEEQGAANTLRLLATGGIGKTVAKIL
jgi:ferritin-like metal-binding protein YciE